MQARLWSREWQCQPELQAAVIRSGFKFQSPCSFSPRSQLSGSCHVPAAWFLAGAYKDSDKRHELNEIKNEVKYEMVKKDMEIVKKDMEIASWKAEANFMASKVRAVGRYRGMCDLLPHGSTVHGSTVHC